MSEPKPVWEFEPMSVPETDFDTTAFREFQLSLMAMAFAVPPNLLGPIVAEAFQPFFEAVDEYTDTMARLALELEELRMKMIGRRYQAIFAVLVVVVYLIVFILSK